MQRTTLSISSTAEIMITETCSAPGVALSCWSVGDPVELRHEDVEEDDVARILGEELEGFATVRAARTCGRPLEQASKSFRPTSVVVGDQDRSRHRLNDPLVRETSGQL